MTRQRTTNNDPLNAVIIRPKNKIEKVELNIVTRLLKKNRNKKIKVRRFRSMLAVATNKIGPATAKISEKQEIKNPACAKMIRKEKIKIRRYISILAIDTKKIDPATTKISKKMEIKSPACPKLI